MLKRNIQIIFRLSDKEHRHLKTQVKKIGLSQEAYIRTLIAGYAPKALPPASYHGTMRELNALGNSMNHIAALANATGFFLAEEYARLVDEHRRITLSIQAMVTLPDKL